MAPRNNRRERANKGEGNKWGKKIYIFFKKMATWYYISPSQKKMARGHEQAQVTRNLWVAIHLDCRAKPNKYVPDIQ